MRGVQQSLLFSGWKIVILRFPSDTKWPNESPVLRVGCISLIDMIVQTSTYTVRQWGHQDLRHSCKSRWVVILQQRWCSRVSVALKARIHVQYQPLLLYIQSRARRSSTWTEHQRTKAAFDIATTSGVRIGAERAKVDSSRGSRGVDVVFATFASPVNLLSIFSARAFLQFSMWYNPLFTIPSLPLYDLKASSSSSSVSTCTECGGSWYRGVASLNYFSGSGRSSSGMRLGWLTLGRMWWGCWSVGELDATGVIKNSEWTRRTEAIRHVIFTQATTFVPTVRND